MCQRKENEDDKLIFWLVIGCRDAHGHPGVFGKVATKVKSQPLLDDSEPLFSVMNTSRRQSFLEQEIPLLAAPVIVGTVGG